MFGKIISIFEQNIKLENLSKRVETTLVGVHIVFEDKFKVVAEITSITRDEISCILVGEFINNVFYSGVLNKPTAEFLNRNRPRLTANRWHLI